MPRWLQTVVCALVVSVLAVALAAAAPGSVHVGITAPSYVAIDAASGRTLVGRQERVRRPIASLTKVMTALVVIERGDLARKVRVAPEAVTVEAYREGLVAGKWYTREALLWSSLLQSGNDSATALAIDAGGGSQQAFFDLMNTRARALGMTATTYASPSGLDDRRNLSTALDQAVLARAALRNPTFRKMVGTRLHRLPWPWPTMAKELLNHNKMLATAPGTYGVKTGWTTRAQGCLVIAQRRNGREVIGVVLGSQSIWRDMQTLLDRAFATVQRIPAG